MDPASIARRFPTVKTLSFFNGVDSERFSPGRASGQARRKTFRFGAGNMSLYAGLFGIAEGLDQVLDAAEASREVRTSVSS